MKTLSPLTLAGTIQGHAGSQPDFVVVTIDGAGTRADETRTYGQLWDKGRVLASGLRRLGIETGDKIGLLMANHIEMIDLMVASGLLGAVFVPIDPRTKGEKLAFMLAKSGCKGAVAADYALQALSDVREKLPELRWMLRLDTDEFKGERVAAADIHAFAGIAASADAGEDFPGSQPDEPMQLIYTSGTTGDPKGVVMTHRRYAEGGIAMPAVCGYLPTDRLYNGLSLTHANAQMFTLSTAMFNAMPCVLSRRFSKSRLWDVCRRHGCTTFTLLGGMTTAIYAEPHKADDADNPVRMVLASGMPVDIWLQFEQRFGVRVSEVYGAAEGGLTVNLFGVGPIGSMGKPPPSTLYRIVDEEDNDCPRGAPGELIFRPADGSPAVVNYHGNAEASAKKCEGGWLRMGDIVTEDENGWLFYKHRKGSGVRRNGEFINLASIETVLAEHPDVDDVYVYGLPSTNGAPGEKDVVAAVVPRDAASFDVQRIFAACRAALEPSHVPGTVQVLSQIPKTASEKPQERFLAEAMAADPASVHAEVRPTAVAH